MMETRSPWNRSPPTHPQTGRKRASSIPGTANLLCSAEKNTPRGTVPWLWLSVPFTILYRTVLYRTGSRFTVLSNVELYGTVPCRTLPYRIMPYPRTLPYCMALSPAVSHENAIPYRALLNPTLFYRIPRRVWYGIPEQYRTRHTRTQEKQPSQSVPVRGKREAACCPKLAPSILDSRHQQKQQPLGIDTAALLPPFQPPSSSVVYLPPPLSLVPPPEPPSCPTLFLP